MKPVRGSFAEEEFTPIELIPESHPPRNNYDMLVAEIRAHGTAIAEMQKSINDLRDDSAKLGMNRIERQWRYFRRYLLTWVSKTQGQAPELALRGLRKFLTVWMKDED